MAATSVLAIEASRPPPPASRGALVWIKHNLFADTGSGMITIAVIALAANLLPTLVDWAFLNAVFRPDSAACRAAGAQGACWGAVAEKYRPILFGRYPYAEQWRPALASLALIGAVIATCRHIDAGKRLLLGWLFTLVVAMALLRGGWGGLARVDSALWGGLPLTVLLSVGTIISASPVAVLLALGRRSKLPAIRSLCTLFVELTRAVPLVSVLLLAAFLLPLFLPQGVSIDALLRVWMGLTFFAAAYLAEVLRGGLQAIPRGHLEAAAALGLGYWHTQVYIVLPQAIRTTLPALMNNFISIIKETSLVTVVSLYELTGALGLALSGDLDWREFYLECALFTAAIYWIGCASLSRYSRHLELRLRSDLQR
jgi:general L-amino acid transport system permease protein